MTANHYIASQVHQVVSTHSWRRFIRFTKDSISSVLACTEQPLGGRSHQWRFTLMNINPRKSVRRAFSVPARAAAVVILFGLAGCGGESGPARQPVSGTVTLDGVALPSGTISFVPVDGKTPATAQVSDGVFQIARAEGPASGHYQVEIIAVRPTGKRVRHPDLPSETIEEVHNVIPTRYNVKTELKEEVKPDKENAFKFELSTRKVAARTTRR